MVQYSSSMVSFLAISSLVPFLMSGLRLDCAFKRKGNYTAHGRRSEGSVLLRIRLFNGIDMEVSKGVKLSTKICRGPEACAMISRMVPARRKACLHWN
jgi:hypothetical protein